MIKKILDLLYNVFELSAIYFPIGAKLYLKFHKNSVKKEIEMLDISSSDKVVHIGCGSVPYTCIILTDYDLAEIVGIDKNKTAAINAKNILEKFNLTDRVKIEQGSGIDYDVSRYDIVILSYGINETILVLKHVLSSMGKNTKILFRKPSNKTPVELRSIIDEMSVRRKKLLLNQESILLMKKQYNK